MPNVNDIRDLTAELGGALDAGLKTRGTDIATRLPRAKRKLPRKLKASLTKISEAETRAKVFPHVSQKKLQELRTEKARIEKYVGGIDRTANRKQAARSWAATLVFNLALFAGLMTIFVYMVVQ